MINRMKTHNHTHLSISDTGYRTIPASTKPESEHDYEYLDTLPHCPAFKGMF